MNFVTLTYALFLLIVVTGYWLIPLRLGQWWLLAASLAFYGSWNPIYVPGFVMLLTVNYWLGLASRATSPTGGRLWPSAWIWACSGSSSTWTGSWVGPACPGGG